MSDNNRIDLSKWVKSQGKDSDAGVGNVDEFLSTISFSSMSTFDSCPYSWYFQYVKKLQIPRHTLAMEIGSAFHKIVELFDGKIALDELLATSTFGAYQAEAVLKARRLFERWYSPEKIENIVMKEKFFKLPMRVKEHTVNLIGYIDAVKNVGNQIEVVDYKTGSSLYAQDIQLSIYSLPVFENNDQLMNLKATFDYVAEGYGGAKKSRNITREEAMDVKVIVKGKVSSIIECFEKNNFPAKPGKACRLCPFTVACDYYLKYIQDAPASPDAMSVAELEQEVADLTAKIDTEKRLLDDMIETLDAKDSSRVLRFTGYTPKSTDTDKVVQTLSELNLLSGRYIFLKNTFWSDLAKDKVNIPVEKKTELMNSVETEVRRKLKTER